MSSDAAAKVGRCREEEEDEEEEKASGLSYN